MAEYGEMSRRIGAYLDWMTLKEYSPETIEGRNIHLHKFAAWCQERDITRPQEVTRHILELYQRHLQNHRKPDGQPMSILTRYDRISYLRCFFRWLSKHNLIMFNPAADIEQPHLGERLPRGVLTADEAETVLNRIDLDTKMGVRDRAIVELLYSTGIRRSELCRLKLENLALENGLLMVRQGKGRKDRVVPVGERAAAWLEKYLGETRPALAWHPDDGVVFLNRKGQPLGPKYLTRLVVRHLNAAGIVRKGWACHTFRHTMATVMLEGGADIRYIQEMLGHSKLETTQIYTRVSILKLKEVHAKTHPGARLERSRCIE